MKERFCADTAFRKFVTIDEQAENLAAAGFTAMSFGFLSEESGEHLRFDEVRRAAERSGIRLVNIHLPFPGNSEFWYDDDTCRARLERFYDYIDRAGQTGAESVIIHPTSGPENNYVSDAGTEAFAKLCARARKNGMYVCAENLRSPLHLDWLFKYLDADTLRFCNDVGHEHAYNEGVDYPHRYAGRLGFTHLHDNDGKGDDHNIPGRGNIDWARVKKSYEETGYTGWLNLELMVDDRVGSAAEHAQYEKDAYAALTRIFGE